MMSDCTGSTQAGIKWLTLAGYALPDNLRHSYHPKLHYMTITFTISQELRGTLPTRPEADKSHWIFTYFPHPRRGNAIIVFNHMDNGTGEPCLFATAVNVIQCSCIVQLLFGGWDIHNLPKEAAEIEPFLATIQGHAPLPSWLYKMVHALVEHGSPTFEAVKLGW